MEIDIVHSCGLWHEKYHSHLDLKTVFKVLTFETKGNKKDQEQNQKYVKDQLTSSQKV